MGELFSLQIKALFFGDYDEQGGCFILQIYKFSSGGPQAKEVTLFDRVGSLFLGGPRTLKQAAVFKLYPTQ